MTLEVDTSELRALAVEITRSTGALGAKAAAALRKTAYDIEADAKILAPVDTGNLMNSISTSITGSGSFGSMTAEIGPTAEYGGFVENGTSVHAPQPYMGPAFDRRSPGLVAAFEQIAKDFL